MRTLFNIVKFWVTVIVILVAFFIVLTMTSCNSERRLQRLIDTHGRADTLITIDTIVVNGVRKDTSFVFRSNLDTTFVIQKERLQIRYIQKNDAVTIEGRCDTVTVEVEKYIIKTEIETKTVPDYKLIVLSLLVGAVVALILKR